MEKHLQIISRSRAKEMGMARYFTGKPCKRGHINERFVSVFTCISCNSINSRIQYRKNPQYMISYYEDHKDDIKEYRKQHYIKEKDRAKKLIKKWSKENPQKRKAHKTNRRARLLAADGNHDSSDVEKLLILQKNKCAYCKKCVKNGYHIDHIMPLAKGGSNWPENLQILCPRCNASKGAKFPEDFGKTIGILI